MLINLENMRGGGVVGGRILTSLPNIILYCFPYTPTETKFQKEINTPELEDGGRHAGNGAGRLTIVSELSQMELVLIESGKLDHNV